MLPCFKDVKTMFIKENTSQNNFTFCWSIITYDGESVRPSVFMIDIVDGE